MIQEVVKDMLPFMVIFFIGVIAFADSFQSIKEILIEIPDNGIERDKTDGYYGIYILGYIKAIQDSYDSAIGGGPEIFGEYNEFDWLIYFLCTLFNLIILLNLLIAIISETFSKVAESAV